MPESHESVQSFAVMFDGYAAAVERFQSAAKGNDASATYRSVFEALNWAVMLDERTAKSWAPEGEPLGWGWRERVPGAETMQALRWARNRVHHQWSDALRFDTGGFQFPMTFPLRFAEWVWRSADELPAGERKDPEGEAIYRSRLAGRAARATLAELADAFGFLRQVLEPSSLLAGAVELDEPA